MNLGQWSGHQVFDLRTENCWPETQAALVFSCLLSGEIVDTVNYTVIMWWGDKQSYLLICVHENVFTLLPAAITWLTDPLTAFHHLTNTDQHWCYLGVQTHTWLFSAPAATLWKLRHLEGMIHCCWDTGFRVRLGIKWWKHSFVCITSTITLCF